MRRKLLLALIVVAISALAGGGECFAADSIERVSLIRLMASPESYNNRRIQVAGYFVFEPENHALYLSKDDADNGISAGGIELKSFVDKYNQGDIIKYNRKYVSLIGTFKWQTSSEWPLKNQLSMHVLALVDIANIKSPPYRYCPPSCR